MGQGERPDEGDRAPADAGGATLPGVGAPPPSPSPGDLGTAATMAPGGATMGTQAPRRDIGTDETVAPAPGTASARTMSAEIIGGAGTLPGPHTVADLPS